MKSSSIFQRKHILDGNDPKRRLENILGHCWSCCGSVNGAAFDDEPPDPEPSLISFMQEEHFKPFRSCCFIIICYRLETSIDGLTRLRKTSLIATNIGEMLTSRAARQIRGIFEPIRPVLI